MTISQNKIAQITQIFVETFFWKLGVQLVENARAKLKEPLVTFEVLVTPITFFVCLPTQNLTKFLFPAHFPLNLLLI